MKKNYINPTTAVVTIMTQKFFAQSIITDGNGEVQSVQFGGDFEGDATSVKSRQGNWFDED